MVPEGIDVAVTSEHEDVKSKVLAELESLGICATPQAQNAITQSIRFAPGDISGDSDAMLLGLLRSGSYTVDALELAGADPERLQTLAADSIFDSTGK